MGTSKYLLGYYNMPKAACTSIKNILYRIEYGRWMDKPLEIHKRIRFKKILLNGVHFGTHRLKQGSGNPYTNFTFVRDPGRRAYSAFTEKIWATGPYHIPGARKHLMDHMGYDLQPLGDIHPTIEEVRRAFKQFLNFIEKGDNKHSLDGHWAGQLDRIRKLGTEDCLNFIGRVESFASDMKLILSRVGWQELDIADQRFNEGPKAPYGFDELLDDEIAAQLSILYRDDYVAFGYKQPYEPIITSAPAANAGFKGRIHVGRPDRLGMRLTMLLQAWRFAREINYQTVVYWPAEEINREQDKERDSERYPASDFIDLEATEKAVGDGSLVFQNAWFPDRSIFADSDPNLRGQFPGHFEKRTASSLPNSICVRQFARGLRFKDEKPAQIRKACAQLFQRIIPSSEVLDTLSVLNAAIPTQSFLGVHVRRGDLVRKLRSLLVEAGNCGTDKDHSELRRYIRMLSNKTAPLSSYRNLLNRHQKASACILLFTDSPEMADTMIDQLGSQAPVIAIHRLETPLANSNQRSFAEMLLLARCHTVIGTQSAFSRAASMIGGVPLIDAGGTQDQAENTRQLLKECAGDLLESNHSLNEWIGKFIETMPRKRMKPRLHR